MIWYIASGYLLVGYWFVAWASKSNAWWNAINPTVSNFVLWCVHISLIVFWLPSLMFLAYSFSRNFRKQRRRKGKS